MAMNCDNCPKEAEFIVGNVKTGEQRFLCSDHLADSGPIHVAKTTPAICEMCNAEPPVVVQEELKTGATMATCSPCTLLVGRMGWLGAPAELRAKVDELIDAPKDADDTGGKRRSGGRRGRHVRVVDEDHTVGDDAPGLGDGVAVDQPGGESPAAAEDTTTASA